MSCPLPSYRFEKYIDDQDKFDELGDGNSSITVGKFIRRILVEQVALLS